MNCQAVPKWRFHHFPSTLNSKTETNNLLLWLPVGLLCSSSTTLPVFGRSHWIRIVCNSSLRMRVAGHHISHYIYSCSCLKLLRDNSADATLSMEWFAVCRWSGQTFILIATRVQLLTFKSLHVNDSFLCSLHTYQIHIEKVSFCTMKISVLLGSWSCKTAIVFLRWIKQNSAQIVLTT